MISRPIYLRGSQCGQDWFLMRAGDANPGLAPSFLELAGLQPSFGLAEALS